MRKATTRVWLCLFLAALLQGCGGPTPSAQSTSAPTERTSGTPTSSASPTEFVRRSGDHLVVGSDDHPIRLRGVNFGNDVWQVRSQPSTTHHDEKDYGRVAAMNMNVVRFAMAYTVFEDDAEPYVYRQTGWDWLDQNVAWARSHGIYLILSMVLPQGGYQSVGTGADLWNVPENQDRMTALWQAIADRYKNEPAVAAYELLNEPIVVEPGQWQTLASRLASSIREVDPNHLLIVERTNAVRGQGGSWAASGFFLIDDPNTMYTFHFYRPIEYSHQGFAWAGYPSDGSYPDEATLVEPADATWYTATFDNPTLPSGASDWRYYEGTDYHATDPELLVGKPVLVADHMGSGTAFFDDFVIEEYDENHEFVRDVAALNITSADGWSLWSIDGKGSGALSSEGHKDGASMTLTGMSDDANMSNLGMRFAVTQGHYYRISGWMKGTDVPPSAVGQFRIDFDTSPSGASLYHRNKTYLEAMFNLDMKWARDNQVPVYVGEFGLHASCFEPGKGGLDWVSDMLDLLNASGVSYTYHDYHETEFGIYRNAVGLPDPSQANAPLIDLLTSKE